MKFGEAVKGFLNWRLSLLVAGTAYLVGAIIGFARQYVGDITLIGAGVNPTINVKEQIVSSGSAPAVGNYLFDFFRGFMPSFTGDIWAFIVGLIPLVIGSFVIVGIGTVLVNWGNWANKMTKGKPIRSTALKLGAGALVATILLTIPMGTTKSLIGIDFFTTIIAMGIYYVLVAFALSLLYKVPAIEKFGSKV